MGKGEVNINQVGEENNVVQNDGADIGQRHSTCVVRGATNKVVQKHHFPLRPFNFPASGFSFRPRGVTSHTELGRVR